MQPKEKHIIATETVPAPSDIDIKHARAVAVLEEVAMLANTLDAELYHAGAVVLHARAASARKCQRLADVLAQAERAHGSLVTPEDLAELGKDMPPIIVSRLHAVARRLNAAIRAEWPGGLGALHWRKLVQSHVSRKPAGHEILEMRVIDLDGFTSVKKVAIDDDRGELPNYLGGRQQPVGTARLDAALASFVDALKNTHDIDPRALLSRVRQSSIAQKPRSAKKMRRGAELIGAEAPPEEPVDIDQRDRTIWQDFMEIRCLQPHHGYLTNVIYPELAQRNGVSERTVRTAVARGKKGELDREPGTAI